MALVVEHTELDRGWHFGPEGVPKSSQLLEGLDCDFALKISHNIGALGWGGRVPCAAIKEDQDDLTTEDRQRPEQGAEQTLAGLTDCHVARKQLFRGDVPEERCGDLFRQASTRYSTVSPLMPLRHKLREENAVRRET